MTPPTEPSALARTARLALDPLAAPVVAARIDAAGLTQDQWVLTRSAWIGLAGLVVMAPVLLWVRDVVISVRFPLPGGVTYEAPLWSMFLAALGFVLGQALVLTGAAAARKRVLAGVLLLFAVTCVSAVVFDTAATDLRLLAALVLVAGGTALALYARRRELALQRPLALVGLNLALLAPFVGLYLLGGATPERFRAIDLTFRVWNWVATPMWLMAGLGFASFSVGLGRKLAGWVHATRSEGSLPLVAAGLLLANAVFSGGVMLLLVVTLGWGQGARALGVDAFLSVPIAAVALLLMVLGRWNARNSAVALAMRGAAVVYALAFLIMDLCGLNLTDPVGTAVEKSGLVPPALLFMLTMALGCLAFFAPYANSEDERTPRAARLPLALGLPILICTMMFWFLNARDVQTGEDFATGSLLGMLLTLGAVFLGLPSLLWTAFRRPEACRGTEEEWEREAARGQEATGLAGCLPVAFLLALPVMVSAVAVVLGIIGFFGLGR